MSAWLDRAQSSPLEKGYIKYADISRAGLLTLCLCWIDTCLVGVLSDEGVGTRVGLGSGLDVHAIQCTACKCVHPSDVFHGDLYVLFEQLG